MQIRTHKCLAKIANNVIPQDSWAYEHGLKLFLRTTYNWRMQYNKLISVEIPLTNRCNLNCIGCITYSPLVVNNKDAYDINTFECDIKQLAKIDYGHNRIGFISLTGGESLLNNDIKEYIKIARHNFPNTILRVRTNGLLISKMSPTFWDACKDNNVTFGLTKYPVSYMQDAENIIKRRGFKLSISAYGGDNKQMFLIPLDKNGGQQNSHKICPQANCGYITLINGRAYNCMTSAFINNLNQYFGLNFQTTDQDSVDIYSIYSIMKIIDFKTKPIPFCRYCDCNNSKFGIPWSVSKRKLSEWVRE
ncbi:MAG: radical SAM protein [Proteobacteria bacterium]|nr:radical SAM protein [Pseudomonadota bacterium]